MWLGGVRELRDNMRGEVARDEKTSRTQNFATTLGYQFSLSRGICFWLFLKTYFKR